MVPLVLQNDDQTPFDGDARNALNAVLNRFANRPGFDRCRSLELEFYLADPKAVDGALSNPLTGASVIHEGVLSLDDLRFPMRSLPTSMMPAKFSQLQLMLPSVRAALVNLRSICVMVKTP